ncbi:penicillin-binding transpeptidase domain-containing protein [Mangrovihabitans endophyticus]|uniref:Peptidoglycan synthetase FtsI n=1 Tax=Mangrovihabitans endophyticus TaxID=1751298 RepID=A0A8J3BVC8_9ACTN|nr:penicillin-binding transpeptidase domain-containing protein [Mangrovihabitans endophyticus]GGK70527.1 hypothetical protein GCM10012284_00490 [Mangrovihabitans endophyticus]
MSPRSDDDQPPRRASQARRGASRDVPAQERPGRRGDPDADGAARRGFGGIGEARAYTPRGRTVAERDQRTRSPRAARTSDPFRPPLKVLDGGQPDEGADRRGRRDGARDEQDRSRERDRAGRRSGADAGGAGRADGATRGGRETRNPRRAGRPAAGPERGRTVAAAPEPRRTATGRPDRGRTGSDGAGARADRARASSSRSRPAPQRASGARPGAESRRAAAPAAPPRLASSGRRLRLSTVLVLVLFATIGVRLIVLQVAVSPDAVQSLMQQRQNRLTEVILPAPRGSILDSSGAVLAQSVEARYIYADPVLVENGRAVAAKLSPLLGVPASKLVSLMAPKKRPGGGQSRFEYLARGVDIQVADKIAAMDLAGIGEGRDERRDVPGADLAANLIGFTGEDHTGLEGLEARYDDLLRGTDGKRVFEIGNPNAGKGELAKEIPGGYHKYTPAQPGTSLQLTINRDLQFEVQRILTEQDKKMNATKGGAVVLDVRTGEVLAQASFPTYNAAKPFDYKPSEREDVPSTVIADPGSTHKAFVFGAALQEGVITPESTITVGPALERGGYPFPDTHPQPRGTKLTMAGVLAYSSNVGTILIGDKLGPERLYEYQQKFGLGQATGEGMPAEASGKLLAPDQWSASASGSIPIGLSVNATLIQMAAGYGAIANDGTYIQPHLIKATIDPDGTPVPAIAPETHRVLSPAVASELRTLMEAVVDEKDATGTQAAVDGYRVAGKTGTAPRWIDGQYTSYNTASFIGMAPADNPRFVVAVSAIVPRGGGGDVSAPAFSEIMSLALRHYRVPPTGTPKPTFKIHP